MQLGKLKLDRCRYGWMLHSGPYIGKCLELYGQYSEAEVEVLRLLLHEGNTAIDVGANIGDLTVPMSQFVRSTGRVYAFESHIETYQILNANLAPQEIVSFMMLALPRRMAESLDLKLPKVVDPTQWWHTLPQA